MTRRERQKLRVVAAAIYHLLGELDKPEIPHAVVSGWLCVGTMALRQLKELGVWDPEEGPKFTEYDYRLAQRLVEHEVETFRKMAEEEVMPTDA